jgi:hypothetical protein
MSRITGNDAYGLMEAYSAVYQPRLELTEEQIWEEVEDWVNELIEEGYDLSDYTWEEMYEAYIEEARAEGVKPYKPQPLKPLPQAKPLSGEKGSGEGYGDISKFKQDTDANKFKPGVDIPKVKTFGRISKAMPPQISGHATKTISANTRTVGGDQGAPRSQKIAQKPKLSREIIRRPQAEEVDVYDIILSHLLDEGYANSVDAAEAIMVNMSEDWRDIIIEEILDEAEGSYGQTPKARTAMGKLLMARSGKPASEYGKRGEKTRKVKAAEKHTRRMDNGPDVGNRGKRSTSPRWSGYLGATGRGKLDQDSRDWSRERDVEYSAGENKPGSGSVTRNPKKLRKQRAMGEID